MLKLFTIFIEDNMLNKVVVFFLLLSFSLPAQQNTKTFNEYYKKGMDHYQKKEYTECINSFLEALQIEPSSTNARYNLACAYSLNGNKKEAISLLDELVSSGQGLDAENDGDFSAIRNSPEFRTILEKIKKARVHLGSSRRAFTINEKDLIPEGLTYDPATKTFYLSSIYKAKILSFGKNKPVRGFTTENQDGLWPVIGMKVDSKRGVIWANSSAGNRTRIVKAEEQGQTGIFKFDLKTGRLIKKYLLKEPGKSHFFNDLAIAANGDIYITNSNTPSVYMIDHNTDELKMHLDLKEYIYPNGIAVSDDNLHLYVAHSNGVLAVDLKSGDYKAVSHPDNISLNYIDGLYFYKNSLIGIQNFGFNRVARFFLNNELTGVKSLKVIEANNPDFNIPTTGVVAEGEFYYIANAQLGSFDKDGKILPLDQLKDIVILKAKL